MVRPSLVQAADDAEHVLDHRGREAQRRLVEHDELGPPHQAAADRHHLLLAARKRAGELAPPLGEARKQLVHIARALGRLARAPRPHHRAHREIVGDRQVSGKSAGPRRPGRCRDAQMRCARPAGDVLALEADAAARRALHAGDGADERGLAGAIGADDGDDLARRHLERDVARAPARRRRRDRDARPSAASQRSPRRDSIRSPRDRAPRVRARPRRSSAP